MQIPFIESCSLHYRPLREGEGEGDAPPWTVETYACGDVGTPPDGPARDALSELARSGGRWLAFTSQSRASLTLGEYIVRDGAVEPLARWHERWPIAWWENPERTGVDLLRVDSLHPACVGLAIVAWVRTLLVLAPRRSVMDTAAGEEILARWVCNLDTWEGEFRLMLRNAPPSERSLDMPVRVSQFLDISVKVSQFLDIVAAVDRNVRDDPRVIRGWGRVMSDAQWENESVRANRRVTWGAAWDSQSTRAIRRVVGDAWFLRRALEWSSLRQARP